MLKVIDGMGECLKNRLGLFPRFLLVLSKFETFLMFHLLERIFRVTYRKVDVKILVCIKKPNKNIEWKNSYLDDRLNLLCVDNQVSPF